VKYDVLQTLFKNGGTADWEMLEECNYDFEDIWNKMLQFVDIYNMDFNDILAGAGDVFKSNIEDAIQKKIKELENDLEHCIINSNSWYDTTLKIKELENLDPSTDIEMYTNCLDTNMHFRDADTQQLYKTYLKDEIEEENNKIGFVYLDLEEEL